MAVMMARLYAALRAANVPDQTAREAAEEAAGYEDRFDRVEARIGKIETDLAVLKWMTATNIALTVLVLGKLFVH